MQGVDTFVRGLIWVLGIGVYSFQSRVPRDNFNLRSLVNLIYRGSFITPSNRAPQQPDLSLKVFYVSSSLASIIVDQSTMYVRLNNVFQNGLMLWKVANSWHVRDFQTIDPNPPRECTSQVSCSIFVVLVARYSDI